MIKRRLNQHQRRTLEVLLRSGAIGVKPICLRLHQIAFAAVVGLKREKLAYEAENGSYLITEAGRRALVEGLYEKQPLTINSGTPSILAGMKVTVGPNGEIVDPTYPSGRPL